MNKNSLNIFESKIQECNFGKNVTIIKPVNLYFCSIGDNSKIGPFTEIQSDVKIGNNTSIQSHSFICSKVKIGDNCFIGHGVMFINDKFKSGEPARGKNSIWQETNLSNNVYVGSNSTILPISICSNVVIGAGAVVTKDIIFSGKYVGNPAIKIE